MKVEWRIRVTLDNVHETELYHIDSEDGFIDFLNESGLRKDDDEVMLNLDEGDIILYEDKSYMVTKVYIRIEDMDPIARDAMAIHLQNRVHAVFNIIVIVKGPDPLIEK